MDNSASLSDDLRAIEDVNQRDVRAVLAGDAAMMMSQWCDDIVVLPPAGPILRGRRANEDVVLRGMEHAPFTTVEWELDIEEVKVLGDYAFQWGSYRGGVRPSAGGDVVRAGGKLMRILRREADGSWKMYRTMFTADSAAP
jgi:uncharacterized protein (TIGR02246 family)